MLSKLTKYQMEPPATASTTELSVGQWVTRALRPLKEAQGRLSGHAWSIIPYGLSTVSNLPILGGREFESAVCDPTRGWVPIRGILHRHKTDSRTLVIIVHGIASSPRYGYLKPLTRAAFRGGSDVLRLALRGALGTGSDHYHAGQTEDLTALFGDPRLAQYDEIFVAGFSLGGQIGLRFGTQCEDPRLKGVIALCAPICMKSSQVVLDAPSMLPYRLPILRELKRKYRALSRNGEREGRPLASALEDVNRVRSFYEWDQTVVCPRYGYSSVEDYYRDVSVGPHLSRLRVPTLMVFAKNDPMIPYPALKTHLDGVGRDTQVRVVETGGHLGFSRKLDLGLGADGGLARQVCSWIQAQSEA